MSVHRGRYEPVTLTAAITGGDILPCQSPNLPRGARGIAEAAIAAAEAGATCVHLHARMDDGRPTADPAVYAAIASRIREHSDVVLNVTTGGAPGMGEAERLAGIKTVKPEIGTLNLGSMNYELFPDPDRWPEVEHSWEREIVEESGSGLLLNTLAMLRSFAAALREAGVTPELEAYDLGHIHMARRLLDEGSLSSPVRLQLVLGVLGGAGNRVEDLCGLAAAADQILGEDLQSLAVAATGFPMQLRHATIALAWGLNVRVGLEDSVRAARDRVAADNAELVRAAVAMAELVERPIQTPAELRAELRAAGRPAPDRSRP